jgi:BolA protein
MTLQNMMQEIINKELQPHLLEIENESSKHAHGSSESHFKVLIVSDKFQNMNRVKRQQWVYQLLEPVMKLGIHALSQRALTISEWKEQTAEFRSPDCGHQMNKKN